jgi:hypothetical protein
MIAGSVFLSSPDPASPPVASLAAGDEIRILDNSRGWAWGYGPNGLVGYVSAESLAP